MTDIANILTHKEIEIRPNIRELNLNYNKLGHEAGKHIVKLISQNDHIIKLGIAFNQLSNENAEDIANAVEKNNRLQ